MAGSGSSDPVDMSMFLVYDQNERVQEERVKAIAAVAQTIAAYNTKEKCFKQWVSCYIGTARHHKRSSACA